MSRRTDYYTPPSKLTEKEVTELWDELVPLREVKKPSVAQADRCEQIRNDLALHYMELVYQSAHRISANLPSHVDVNDLISAGNFGLLEAINKFDPEQGVLFSTYSTRRIWGSIKDELRRQDWAPRLVRMRASQLERSRDELENKLGRKPTHEELAEHMELDPEEFEAILREGQVKTIVSLDRKWDEDDDHELGQLEMVPDNTASDPLSEMTRKELKEIAIKGLSDNEKYVLTMYYYDDMNFREIGATLGLSESRVCQIHTKILKFLHQKFKARDVISPHDV